MNWKAKNPFNMNELPFISLKEFCFDFLRLGLIVYKPPSKANQCKARLSQTSNLVERIWRKSDFLTIDFEGNLRLPNSVCLKELKEIHSLFRITSPFGLNFERISVRLEISLDLLTIVSFMESTRPTSSNNVSNQP